MSEQPLEQFNIINLISIRLADYNFHFTNSSLFMLIAFIIVSIFFIAALKNAKMVPGTLQSTGEILYEFISNTVQDNIGEKGEKFIPFIFSIFMFILTLNLLGLLPYSFTVTSHLSVTLSLAVIVFITVTVIAFFIHGKKFFSFFLPKGTPLFLAPLIILIELFSYLIRPMTLSVRLAANMIAGHILLFIVAGFITTMGFWGWIPIPFVVIFDGFELFVAVLQAYIFTILSCVYLNDAINLH